jgi:ATP/maltotriose-dependent transcriptional regulator MalT
MTMPFSFHDNLDSAETTTHFEFVAPRSGSITIKDEKIHLIAEKMRVPEFGGQILRPRLNNLLKKSSLSVGATLVAGRAGTGKTALAAGYAKNYERVAWYQVEAADTDWKVFSRYFAAIFDEPELGLKNSGAEISLFVERLFTSLQPADSKPLLIVLDDIHNVFDTAWFGEFFVSLLYSLTPATHLVLLSRAKPAQPLWRLRSKQVLGVIDEKVLAFTIEETAELFEKYGLSAEQSARAQAKCFGRIGKLVGCIEAGQAG